MEKIDAFNEEEAAYGFELSQYPLRKQIHDKLGPFKKLYDNSMDFMTKHDQWLNTKVGTYDPEDIEQDVGVFYRNIYKLEKSFSTTPATQQLATTVSFQKIFFGLKNEFIFCTRSGYKSKFLRNKCPQFRL